MNQKIILYSTVLPAILFFRGINFKGLNINRVPPTTCTTLVSCGDTFTCTHTRHNGVAPVSKTVTYQTVSTAIGGTGDKCWITQNLGALNEATSATDNTEASGGWYFQFNRKQGFQYTTVRTPNTTWISSISESSNWESSKDPCTVELGSGWRLPTYAEYLAADGAPQNWANRNDTYASVLKLHSAGYLNYTAGVLFSRGAYGPYWSSTQYSGTNGWILDFNSSNSYMNVNNKAYGFSVRCLRDP